MASLTKESEKAQAVRHIPEVVKKGFFEQVTFKMKLETEIRNYLRSPLKGSRPEPHLQRISFHCLRLGPGHQF
jgi:hypothetical protein